MPVFSGGYAGPKEIQYLFIDGEQLKRTLQEVGEAWFGEPIAISYGALQGGHQKVFYYDCLPAKSPSEPDEAYEVKRAAKASLFDTLRALPGWHVSEGLARHRKKERQEQKEVDILIAVDMLTHTHRRNMHRLTFLSGDQDFAPLLEAVVREGMYVELLYPENHTGRDLMYFADAAFPLDVEFLYGKATQAFKERHGLPTASFDDDQAIVNAKLIANGFRAGELSAHIWQEVSGTFNIKSAVLHSAGQHLTVRYGDVAMAKRYFERRAGQIEWKAA